MNAYRKRLIDGVINRKLQSTGGLLLEGPRAVGKTTTAFFHAKSAVRLDESQELLNRANLSPKSLLEGETPRLVDEWQLVPSIWNVIRHEIDKRNRKGQFILTGSSAPADSLAMHTGAGRFSRLLLRPMTLFESNDSTAQVNVKALFDSAMDIDGYGGIEFEEYANLIVRGGWPGVVELPLEYAYDAMRDYVDNLTRVDMRTLNSPPDPARMSALMRSLARNVSTEATLKVLSQDAEIWDETIIEVTVRKYLDQLTQIFVLEELPAWKTHIRSSIQARIKPKWHFIDPSLGAAVLRISPDMLLSDLNTMGLYFESLVLRDMRVYADLLDANVYHYRDSSKLEVDMIIERYDGKWSAIEVKLGGEAAISEAISNFNKLKNRLTESKLSNLVSLNVITAGNNSYKRADGVNVISLGHLFVTQDGV